MQTGSYAKLGCLEVDQQSIGNTANGITNEFRAEQDKARIADLEL